MAKQMFDYTRAEVVAGGFVVLGLALLAYLSVSIGGFSFVPEKRYGVSARFSNVGDLKPGAPVKLAGVTVAKVQAIRLANYFGEVDMTIARDLQLPSDTVASIATAGLLGDAYVALSPGAEDKNLSPGSRITRTEPALNLADLLGRYAFGAGGDAKPTPPSDQGFDP
jgi:phospholipid/cholesterol/gamma-HCH transport system substrate-binding protein